MQTGLGYSVSATLLTGDQEKETHKNGFVRINKRNVFLFELPYILYYHNKFNYNYVCMSFPVPKKGNKHTQHKKKDVRYSTLAIFNISTFYFLIIMIILHNYIT